mgnify:CR=1 FL=1|jgi:hypothetical protein
MRTLGYPGVTGVDLPDGGTVTHTSMQENRPYLCVAYDTEQATVQPLRLAAGLLGGPIVMYASRKLPEDEAMLRAVTFLVGAGMSYWSLWVWNKADKAMSPQE